METTMKFSHWIWTCNTCNAEHNWYPVTCTCWRENVTSAKWSENLLLPETKQKKVKPPRPKTPRKKVEKNTVRQKYLDKLPKEWQTFKANFNPRYFEMTEKFLLWNQTYTELWKEYWVSRQMACKAVIMVINSIMYKDFRNTEYETLSWESVFDRIARRRKELWHNL